MHDESVTRLIPSVPGEDPGGAPAQLVIIQGPDRGTVADLAKPEFRIGRRPENDLVLPSGTVSKFHGVVHTHGTDHSIEDLGSTNGIVVNAVRISARSRHRLLHGDSIAIGEYLLVYRKPASGFVDHTGLSTISFDVEKVREEADALLRDLPELKRPPRP